MKLKCLCTSMLGQHGQVIEMADKERARQLIAKKVCEEFKPEVKIEEKKTKGGKKPKELETK